MSNLVKIEIPSAAKITCLDGSYKQHFLISPWTVMVNYSVYLVLGKVNYWKYPLMRQRRYVKSLLYRVSKHFCVDLCRWIDNLNSFSRMLYCSLLTSVEQSQNYWCLLFTPSERELCIFDWLCSVTIILFEIFIPYCKCRKTGRFMWYLEGT